MVAALIQGMMLLLALCFLHGANIRLQHKHARARPWADGLVFGVIALAGMALPWPPTLLHSLVTVPALILSMAGLFCGATAAALATAMALLGWAGLHGGGSLAEGGLLLLSTAAGLVAGRVWGRIRFLPGGLAVIGLLLQAAIVLVLSSRATHPAEGASAAVASVLVLGLASALVGWLLHDTERHLNRTASRLQTEAALRESEIRFRSLLRDIPSISVQGYGADGTTTYWNKAAERIYGYSAGEALGRSLFDLIIPAEMQAGVRHAVAEMFRTKVAIPASELRLKHKNGHPVDVFSSHAYVQVPGQAPELFCIDVDIAERKAAEEKAHFLAFYDALTGLPNRRLLMDRLEQVVAHSARTGLCAAVLLVDLDHFKNVNDSLGHDAGDELLLQVTARLRDGVRDEDTLARLGGDEFIIVLGHLQADKTAAAEQARTVGEKILAQLSLPCPLGREEHRASASIGVALLVPGQASADALLRHADLAMHQAKEAGRNALRFFDPEMQASIDERMLLQADLHRALRNGEFELFYQPQVNAMGQVVGAEALVRWHHPEKGLVAPNLFIPLAEETGQIIALGHWVLASALQQQARWRADPQREHLTLSINVSACQFRQAGFVDEVRELLSCHQADPRRIKLELTESLLLQDVQGVIATMHALRTLGLSLALDDFGTGYSSMGYLKQLPLDQIKIDQGFVRNIVIDTRDAAIAKSIITLSQHLDLQVVAEGVETEAHYEFLLAQGCRAFQGYWFGRPQPLAAFERALS